jgi:hypothetical protein
VPTKQENGTNASFSNQIEYYIIQDRGSYNPASGGKNPSKKGEATIDGIAYEFWVCDRINEASISGNGQTFKQFFSVPKSTSSHRQRGLISVSEHFKEWAKVGMDMNGSMYEVAMKVESYTGDSRAGNGSAKVTKNILCIGSGCGSSGGSSSSSRPSSSSTGGGSQTCGEYQTSFCGGMAYADVLGNSTTMPTNGQCLYIGDFEVIQPALSSTIAINGVENTCGSDWDDCTYNDKPATTKDGGYYVFVKTGSVNDYENNGWQGIVAKAKPACVATSSSSAAASSSSRASSSSATPSSNSTTPSSNSATPSSSSASTLNSSSSEDNTPILTQSLIPNPQSLKYYNLKGEPLGTTKPVNPGVYIEKNGKQVHKIVVR